MRVKRVILRSFLVFCAAFLIFQASTISAQQTEKTTFTILTCTRGGLDSQIKSALDKIAGIVKYRFDDYSSVLNVTFYPDKTNVSEIGRALKKAGLDYQ